MRAIACVNVTHVVGARRRGRRAWSGVQMTFSQTKPGHSSYFGLSETSACGCECHLMNNNTPANCIAQRQFHSSVRSSTRHSGVSFNPLARSLSRFSGLRVCASGASSCHDVKILSVLDACRRDSRPVRSSTALLGQQLIPERLLGYCFEESGDSGADPRITFV